MMTRRWATIAVAIVPVIAIALPVRADWAADMAQQITSTLVGTPQPEPPTGTVINYGTDAPLTQQQSNILTRQELRFPQTYRAIVSKLGYPNQRDDRADYYDLVDGRRVAIVYSGTTAVAVEGL